jgi:hypothetical protein
VSFLVKWSIKLIPDSHSFPWLITRSRPQMICFVKMANQKMGHTWNFNGSTTLSFALFHHYSFRNNCWTHTKLFVVQVRPLFPFRQKDINFEVLLMILKRQKTQRWYTNALAELSYHPAKTSRHGFLKHVLTVCKVLLMAISFH